MDSAWYPVARDRVDANVHPCAALLEELAARPGLDRGEAGRFWRSRANGLDQSEVSLHPKPLHGVVSDTAKNMGAIGWQWSIHDLAGCRGLHVGMVKVPVIVGAVASAIAIGYIGVG